MPTDLPPNLASAAPHSEVRYAQEQDKERRRREEARKKAQDADMRLKSQQTKQEK